MAQVEKRLPKLERSLRVYEKPRPIHSHLRKLEEPVKAGGKKAEG